MLSENIVKTGNGNRTGIVTELHIATALFCYVSFTTVRHFQYHLCYSVKSEIPRNINNLQVRKLGIKHHTLHMWNMKDMVRVLDSNANDISELGDQFWFSKQKLKCQTITYGKASLILESHKQI